jgi:hypothetical protein
MRLFCIFKLGWLLFIKQLHAGREPHTRKYGTLGLNRSFIKSDFLYTSRQNDERGYDYRYPPNTTDDRIFQNEIKENEEHPDFADKIAKLAQLKELKTLYKSLSSPSFPYLNTITPEYLNACMGSIDEAVYMNIRMAVGESSVLNEVGHSLPPTSSKRIPIEPLNTQPSIYSIRDIQKGGLLDDFNKVI